MTSSITLQENFPSDREGSVGRRRFVILEHHYRGVHWDLMIQDGKILRTWALLELPRPGQFIPGDRIQDHRLLYLDYEGPISRNRGFVRRFDAGDVVLLKWEEDQAHVWFEGTRLQVEGFWIRRCDSKAGNSGWRFV